MMSNIDENLKKIESAVWGKDVRKAIHDSIHDCYADGKAGATDLLAREGIENLENVKADKTEVAVERARINNLSKMKDGSTTGDAELQDIRIGADGKKYPNAGEAVRGQLSELKEDMANSLPKIFPLNITEKCIFEDGYFDVIQGRIIDNAQYKHCKIKAYQGDVFLCSGQCTLDGRLYALVSNSTVIKYYPQESTATYTNTKIEITEPCDLYVNAPTKTLKDTVLYKLSNYTNVTIDSGKSFNLVNIEMLLSDKIASPLFGSYLHYVDTDGFMSSDYIIPCKMGDIIYLKLKYVGIIYLDSDFKVVSSISVGDAFSTTVTEQDAKYFTFYFTKPTNGDKQVITINNKIPSYYVPYGVTKLYSEAETRRGLNWAAVGDSLTDVKTLNSDSHGSKNYVDFVSESLKLNTTNNGVAGTGYIANNSGAAKTFVERIDEIPSDAELITIFGSFNDVYQGFEIGTINDDKATNTLYGKLKEFYETLFAKRPDAIVGLITPIPWEMCCRYNISSDKYEKTIQYVTALLDIAKLYSIPVLNLFDESDMRPYDSVFRKAYYRDNDDNVHPNQKGHEKYISPKVVDFIRKITMYD